MPWKRFLRSVVALLMQHSRARCSTRKKSASSVESGRSKLDKLEKTLELDF